VAVSQPLPGVTRDAARATPKVNGPKTSDTKISDPKITVPEVGVPKISVIVPTFAPGELLNRVVRSIETQTMPAEDFEVIFVDDGSPDDTWQRLENIRDSHRNVRIERIEHSGWPSKPRNVGLELSRGEYVLFMDHDDELYPRALEAGYAMAAGNGADVLNGKETRTDQAAWGLSVYTTNMDNAIDRQDIHPLIPTNPHKLFRRGFLMEHQIRFPEGRRVLWEDVFFALDIASHAKVISVLADTPFYHWVRGRRTTSSSFTQDLEEYWHWVRKIVQKTNENLSGPTLEGQWRLMLLHQYRSRVLARLDTRLFKGPSQDFELVKAMAEDIIHNHIPVELDAGLSPTDLGKAVLVRGGRWDLLEKLVGIDSGLIGTSAATSVRWVDGSLLLKAESRWTGPRGARLAIRYDGDRIVRDLPSDVAAALPEEAIDMTAALADAHTSIGVRARDTGVVWMLPGECEPGVKIADGPELVVTATASLDPSTAIFGRPLDENSWDFTARNEFLGRINQRGLRTSPRVRSALRNDHVYIVYRSDAGILSLDVDERNRSLGGSAPLDPDNAISSLKGTAGTLRLPLRRVHTSAFEIPFAGVATSDDSEIEGSVTVGDGPRQPAWIVAREDGAWLESTLQQRAGTYHMTLNFHGREMDSGLRVTVGTHGELAFSRPGDHPEPQVDDDADDEADEVI
jgi:glycosyltransferase involved in cell wall biosynthesis